MIKFSDEQQKIIDAVGKYNVIVDAVAGSGKTTTSFGVIKKHPDKKVLMLTYSKTLQDETKVKLKEQNIKNAKIFTYHGYAGRLFRDSCRTDEAMREMLFSSKYHSTSSVNYDFIIIDEAQDLRVLYLCLIRKIFSLNKNKKFKVLVMGDFRQSIYEYDGADSRYMTNFPDFFEGLIDGNWKHLTLKQSYRVGKNTVKFVNKAFYKKNIMVGKEQKDFIEYIPINPKDLESGKGTWIEYIANQIKKYGVDDTFILARSIKENIPKNIGMKLNTLGFKIENNGGDYEKNLNVKNKLAFSTFHGAKGLERKLVIIINFDSWTIDRHAQSLEEFYDPYNHNPEYVAITRATEKLIILSSFYSPPLYFLDKEWLIANSNMEYLDYDQGQQYLNNIMNPKTPEIRLNIRDEYPVTDLCTFIKENNVTELKKGYSVVDKEKLISDDITKKFKEVVTYIECGTNSKLSYTENVSSYNGTAIVSQFADSYSKQNPLLAKMNRILDMLNKINNNVDLSEITDADLYLFVKATFFSENDGKILDNGKWLLQQEEWLRDLTDDKLRENISEFMKLVVIHNTSLDNRTFAAAQIDHYDWMDRSIFELSSSFLKDYFGKDKLEFEKPVVASVDYKATNDTTAVPVRVQGFIDCYDMTANAIYEFKFVNSVDLDQYLQLTSYCMIMYLLSKIDKNFDISTSKILKMKCYLFNLKDGMRYELKINYKLADEFFNTLIKNKSSSANKTDFLKLLSDVKKEFLKIK